MLLLWVVVFSQPNMMAVGLDGCCLSTVPKDSSSMAAWVLSKHLKQPVLVSLSALLPAAQVSLDEVDIAKITAAFSSIRSFGISFAITSLVSIPTVWKCIFQIALGAMVWKMRCGSTSRISMLL